MRAIEMIRRPIGVAGKSLNFVYAARLRCNHGVGGGVITPDGQRDGPPLGVIVGRDNVHDDAAKNLNADKRPVSTVPARSS